MAQPSKNSSVIVVRAKSTTALCPSTLGFASFVTPDTYDPLKPMFKGNFHFEPQQITILKGQLETVCGAALFAKLQEEADQNKLGKMKPVQSIEDWLAAKLKEPKEQSKIQLPYMVITCKATGKDRGGEVYEKTIGCWDAHNKPLNLKGMKLGMGSIVQPVVTPALFFSKLIGFPQPKLYLAGVRVLKRVSFGGAQPPQETDDEAIREALSDPTFEVEDLSAFAAGVTAPVEPGHEAPEADLAGKVF